jgi:chromosome segregation ATPase
LTKEKQVIQEIIQNDIQSGTNNSMSAAVTALCERLHMLEEERAELLESKQNLHEALEESTKKLHEVAMQKTKLEETLNDAREEVSNLNLKQKQFQQIAENVKSSAKDLEEEKNRQVSYLEKENLQILEENRKLKQELRSLKTHSKPALSAFQEEPTEDLGSILSNFTYQDKENNENGVRKSTAHIKQSNAKARVGLGSGEGEVNEDNTQECHQS